MKENRKVVLEHTEKDIIYVHNLVEVLAKKYHEDLIKYKNNSQNSTKSLMR